MMNDPDNDSETFQYPTPKYSKANRRPSMFSKRGSMPLIKRRLSIKNTFRSNRDNLAVRIQTNNFIKKYTILSDLSPIDQKRNSIVDTLNHSLKGNEIKIDNIFCDESSNNTNANIFHQFCKPNIPFRSKTAANSVFILLDDTDIRTKSSTILGNMDGILIQTAKVLLIDSQQFNPQICILKEVGPSLNALAWCDALQKKTVTITDTCINESDKVTFHSVHSAQQLQKVK